MAQRPIGPGPRELLVESYRLSAPSSLAAMVSG